MHSIKKLLIVFFVLIVQETSCSYKLNELGAKEQYERVITLSPTAVAIIFQGKKLEDNKNKLADEYANLSNLNRIELDYFINRLTCGQEHAVFATAGRSCKVGIATVKKMRTLLQETQQRAAVIEEPLGSMLPPNPEIRHRIPAAAAVAPAQPAQAQVPAGPQPSQFGPAQQNTNCLKRCMKDCCSWLCNNN